MNEISCEVARDLMPLVIDEAASAGSTAAVEAHLAECDACREVMTALRRALPQAAPADPDTRFIGLCRRLERSWRWSRLRWALLGLLLALALVGLGVLAHYGMYEWGRDMVFEPGAVQLMTDSQGWVTAEYDAPSASHPARTAWAMDSASAADGRVTLVIRPQESAWPQIGPFRRGAAHMMLPLDGLRVIDGQLVCYVERTEEVSLEGGKAHTSRVRWEAVPVAALRFGGGEGILVYEAGDAIPHDERADDPGLVDPFWRGHDTASLENG